MLTPGVLPVTRPGERITDFECSIGSLRQGLGFTHSFSRMNLGLELGLGLYSGSTISHGWITPALYY